VYFCAAPEAVAGAEAGADVVAGPDEGAPHVELDEVPQVDEAPVPPEGCAGVSPGDAASAVAEGTSADDVAASVDPVSPSPALPGEAAGLVDAAGAVDAAEAASDAAACGGGTVRSLMQYRHLMASSWISSAQYGHFFTMALRVHPPRSSTAPAYSPGLGRSPVG
jgi:hypothetical protein